MSIKFIYELYVHFKEFLLIGNREKWLPAKGLLYCIKNKEKNMSNHKLEIKKFAKRIIKSDSGQNNLFFLTIRFVNDEPDIYKAKESTRRIMSRILFNLQGRNWYKKTYKGLYVFERGKFNRYHVHILLNTEDKTAVELKSALIKVQENCYCTNICFDFIEDDEQMHNFNLKKNHICVKPVYNLNGVINYMLKEFQWDAKHINFDAFYTESQIFNDYNLQ